MADLIPYFLWGGLGVLVIGVISVFVFTRSLARATSPTHRRACKILMTLGLIVIGYALALEVLAFLAIQLAGNIVVLNR